MIEDAAMGYLTAMGNYKIQEAEAYASEETIEKTLHVIEEVIMPNLDPNYVKQNTPASIEITEVNQLSDTTAEVKYVKTTPIQVQEGSLGMVKRNHEWKALVIIQLPKAMEIQQQVDSKALEEKYKGKLTPGKPGQAPPSAEKKTEQEQFTPASATTSVMGEISTPKLFFNNNPSSILYKI